MSTLKLAGKTFLVVGAGGRLGKVITNALLDAQSNVVALDSNADAIARVRAGTSSSSNLYTLQLDITDAHAVGEALKDAKARFGDLDGAVNSAYPRNTNYGKDFLDVTHKDFSENLSLHLGGYFVFMQQCVRFSMENSSAFSLVNMSSVYGVIAPKFEVYEGTGMGMPVEYAAIKSGLQHITRYANAFAKGTGFRANCLCPGGILDGQADQFLQRYGAHCQNKGMLDAEDVVGSTLFLLSPLSQHIVGQVLVVDDGFTL
ncbi:oxidoreductase [Pseudomonas caspiana]|uniref:oxidoreductase n=1 Tax=Pseudomonas caspiana TaxID=1451454 RepID=UPI0032EEEF5D